MKLWDWLLGRNTAPVIPASSKVEEVSTENYVPNPIRLVVVSLPPDMTPDLANTFTTMVEQSVSKVGGFGGVSYADPKGVRKGGARLEYKRTHQPYIVIREVKGKVYETTLNTVIDQFLNGRTMEEIGQNGISVFAYEYDEVSNDIVDAWWMPSVFYGRSEIDGRQDARLIYLEVFGDVKEGEDYKRIAQDIHEHRLIKSDVALSLTATL